MGIKPGPKRKAKSTGKPDRRQRDNKKTPGNTPSLKPHKHKEVYFLLFVLSFFTDLNFLPLYSMPKKVFRSYNGYFIIDFKYFHNNHEEFKFNNGLLKIIFNFCINH